MVLPTLCRKTVRSWTFAKSLGNAKLDVVKVCETRDLPYKLLLIHSCEAYCVPWEYGCLERQYLEINDNHMSSRWDVNNCRVYTSCLAGSRKASERTQCFSQIIRRGQMFSWLTAGTSAEETDRSLDFRNATREEETEWIESVFVMQVPRRTRHMLGAGCCCRH